METINARIKSTMIGYEDHGIMTAYLMLEYDGCGQGFGGYGLDEPGLDGGDRMPTIYCGAFIQEVLKAVGVSKWEDLPGKIIRVKKKDKWNGSILAVGNVIEDKWFYPENMKEEYGE